MYKKLDGLMADGSAVLITSPQNMRYFSGFSGGEGAVLCIGDTRILYTDSRYTEQAVREAASFTVEETNNAIGCAAEKICALGIENVCFEDADMTAAAYLKLKEFVGHARLVPQSAYLSKCRMAKTETELEKLRRAEDISCRAFRHILDVIKPGISENDIAAELEYFMRKSGGEGVSFETIAISGKKTSMPHGKPDGKKIEKGDFVTMDFGCVYGGYCADMTRTVVVGRASAEQKRVYETVKTAQRMGLEFLKSGVCARDADGAARRVIEDAGYGKYFGHSLGHGVGLLIHELPNLSPRSEVVLEENMIVTCEPGIYIPDFGGVRIEDMVCIKDGGIENFTYETKELIEL